MGIDETVEPREGVDAQALDRARQPQHLVKVEKARRGALGGIADKDVAAVKIPVEEPVFEPERKRKLLAHKKEILRLFRQGVRELTLSEPSS